MMKHFATKISNEMKEKEFQEPLESSEDKESSSEEEGSQGKDSGSGEGE